MATSSASSTAPTAARLTTPVSRSSTSDPENPETVETFPGITHTWDTLAVDKGRRILVAKTEVGDVIGGVVGSAGFVVFSIGEDCTDLTRRGTFDFATTATIAPFASRKVAPHEFRVTPAGDAVVMSLSAPDVGIGAEGTPSLVIADIRDLDAPRFHMAYDLSAAMRGQGVLAAGIGSHDFDFNPEGTRLYAGLFTGQQQTPATTRSGAAQRSSTSRSSGASA